MIGILILAAIITYAVTAPDRKTLALTRGTAGAAKAGINLGPTRVRPRPSTRSSGTGSAKATGKSSRGRKGSTGSAADPDAAPAPRTRGRAMLAGWHEGVASATKRREEGRDAWSRGTRFAGRVVGGGNNIRHGVRATRGKRDTTSSAAGEPIVVKGTTVSNTATPDPKPAATPPTPAAASTTTNPGTTATKGTPTMSTLGTTELANVNQLSAEIEAAWTAIETLRESFGETNKWAINMPDRWSGTTWSTKGLDAAITGLSEKAPKPALLDGFLEALARVRGEIATARALGEQASAAQATGTIDGFKAA